MRGKLYLHQGIALSVVVLTMLGLLGCVPNEHGVADSDANGGTGGFHRICRGRVADSDAGAGRGDVRYLHDRDP